MPWPRPAPMPSVSCSTRVGSPSARPARRTSPNVRHLVLVCPRYEGIDDRVRSFVDLELSVGDFVLSGGEIAALAVIDAVLRLLPGAIDEASTRGGVVLPRPAGVPAVDAASAVPRPAVPEILVSGDHGAVDAWRHEQALDRTRRNRPDLLGEEAVPGA